MNTELYDFLASVPGERTRHYELSLTEYVLERHSFELGSELEEIVRECRDPQISYNAFYCLNILYRREKDFFKVSELFEKHSAKFSRHITFDHLKVLFEIESGAMYDYSTILNATYKDAELFDDNAGFVHLFADVFATVYENGHIHETDAFLAEWYRPALDAVTKAIRLDDTYAKYYCTKARILCIAHDYDEALNYINTAISIERSDRHDYALRISNYQYYKLMINVDKKLYHLTEALAGSERVFPKELLTDRFAFNESVSGDLIHESDTKPKAYGGNAPYAFVSYSHLNAPEAYKVISLLQQNGINIWFDEGIEIGAEYADYIANKLSGSSAFLLLITPDSIGSEFVRKELQMAFDLKMKPVCVFLKETMLNPGMMIQLNIYEHIHYYEMSESSFLEHILPAIRNQLNAK